MNCDYWFDAIEASLSEVGVSATQEQIEHIAGDMEVCHDQYDMAYGYDVASQNFQASKDDEIAKLKKELQLEREKQTCKYCSGHGHTITQGPCHRSLHTCPKCNGLGRL